MAEDNKSMFVLVSIIAIVAVVGLVVLLMGKSAQYVPVAQPADVGVAEGVSLEEGDLVGEAAGVRTRCNTNWLCKDKNTRGKMSLKNGKCVWSTIERACKYGCKNGACKKAPNNCTDSDWNVLQGGDTFLGNSIYTAGFTQSTESGVPTMANDYCTTNSPKINDPDDGEWKFIIEQICKNMGDGNIEAWTSNQKCPVGYVCPEGKSACVKE